MNPLENLADYSSETGGLGYVDIEKVITDVLSGKSEYEDGKRLLSGIVSRTLGASYNDIYSSIADISIHVAGWLIAFGIDPRRNTMENGTVKNSDPKTILSEMSGEYERSGKYTENKILHEAYTSTYELLCRYQRLPEHRTLVVDDVIKALEEKLTLGRINFIEGRMMILRAMPDFISHGGVYGDIKFAAYALAFGVKPVKGNEQDGYKIGNRFEIYNEFMRELINLGFLVEAYNLLEIYAELTRLID